MDDGLFRYTGRYAAKDQIPQDMLSESDLEKLLNGVYAKWKTGIQILYGW